MDEDASLKTWFYIIDSHPMSEAGKISLPENGIGLSVQSLKREQPIRNCKVNCAVRSFQ